MRFFLMFGLFTAFSCNAFCLDLSQPLSYRVFQSLPGQVVADGNGSGVKQSQSIKCVTMLGHAGGWYNCAVREGTVTGPDAAILFKSLKEEGCVYSTASVRINREESVRCAQTGNGEVCEVASYFGKFKCSYK
jgi:hypothetical protein